MQFAHLLRLRVTTGRPGLHHWRVVRLRGDDEGREAVAVALGRRHRVGRSDFGSSGRGVVVIVLSWTKSLLLGQTQAIALQKKKPPIPR